MTSSKTLGNLSSTCKCKNAVNDIYAPYLCSSCLATNFPFHKITDDEFLKTNTKKNIYSSFFDIIRKTSYRYDKCDILPNNDFECVYYDLNEAKKLFKSDKTSNNFSYFHINIRSLKKNLEKIEELLINLDTLPDIIALTETKINKKAQTYFPNQLFDYQLIHADSDTNSGGVAFFLKNSITFVTRNDLQFECEHCENLWIEVTNQRKKIIIGVIYRHPKYNFNTFKHNLLETIEKMNNEKATFYLSGDFNIDYLKYNSCPRITSYINDIYSYGCQLLTYKPTRITCNSATCIDHFYTNDDITDNNIKTGILISDITDHFPLLLTINSNAPKPRPEVYKFRCCKNFDLELFLENINFSMEPVAMKINNMTSIEDDFKLFESTIMNTINKHAPLRKATRKEKKMHKKPWMTKAIYKSITTKNKLFKRYISTSKVEAHNKYKKYRNKLNHIILAAKTMHYNNQAIKHRSNPREIWNLINDITQNKRTHKREKIQLKENKVVIENPSLIANKFNTFFSEIGSKMAKQVKTPKMPASNQTKSPLHSFQLTNITEDEVVQTIATLNEKKSTKIDDIPSKFLKYSNILIAPILTKLFNKCINQGIYPECLKIAQIIPIYKRKNSKFECTNYRPISMLSQLSKIFEKLIAKRITHYLMKFNLLTDCQFGFREGYSTNTAIIDIYDELLSNRDKKMHTCAIFLDFQKAFDSVDHRILLTKLEKIFGIRGTPLDLLKSYLDGRKQFTTVNGINSSLCDVKIGIPQGSTLGPLLFLLFINDLSTTSVFKTTLFADDAMLSMSSSNISTLEEITNNELAKVENWLQCNKLSLNLSKTSYLLFHNKSTQDKNQLILKIDGVPLTQAHVVKYLGIYIDDELSWIPHIEHLQKQIARSTALLSKLRYYVNIDVRRTVYYSLVHSHLNYGIAAYGSATKTALNKLQVMQNSIMRIITFSNYKHSAKPLLKKLQILNLENMCKLEVGKIMFGCHHGHIPSKLVKLFTKSNKIHSYNTRQASNDGFFIPKTSSQYGKKTIKFRGSKLWNCIPQQIKQAPSISNFKKKFKIYLLEN